jgi:cell fate (sporulation/competence/biofilm development) regulator YlbF (YheA/YmcA/DUF963 family)
MTDLNELLELASRLGEKTAAHQRTTNLRTAQKAVNDDPDARNLIEKYQKHAEHIRSLEAQQKPIEPADKHKLADIEQQISANAALSELTRRQVDFVEMMQQIKRRIDEKLQA